MAKKPKRRKIQGRDWHGWVLKLPVGKKDDQLCWWAKPEKPKERRNSGKWVRVKFVEVD